MKIVLAFPFVTTLLLWRVSLIRGEPGVSERSDQLDVLKDVRLDLTAAMRDKLSGVASHWTHEGSDGGTEDHISSMRRHLAMGDFVEFNQLFENATIKLPDFEVSDRVLGIKFKLRISELYCEDMAVGDIVLTPNKESNQRLTFKVGIVDLALNCYGRFNYDYGFIDGNGSIEANINRSQGSTVLAFSSPDFNLEPPGDSTVESCDSSINIYNMEFRGRIVSKVLDLAKRAVSNRVEGAIEDVACEELSSLGSTFVDDLLALAKTELDYYLEPIPPALSDPLVAERNLEVPEGVTLLNFQETGNTIGAWFNQALKEVDSMLGEVVEDPEGPTADDRDLGVNVFLRDFLLDSDRSLSVRVSDLPGDGFDGIIFQSHDKLTETTITLDAMKIYGLDTFRHFEPLIDIGMHTLENEFRWDYLTIELDVTVDIKPSSLPDSILVDPNPVNIVEVVKISFGVDELDVVIAVLAAIDQDKLGKLQVGSLLNTANIFSCFVSVLRDLEVTGLHVSSTNIREPVLEGFISPGVDRIVSSAVEAAFLMYEPTLIRAMPSIFQRLVRDILNTEVVKSAIFSPDIMLCPLAEGDSSSVDFRDLLLDPDDAARLGGSGELPYGDVGYLLFDIIQQRFQSVDDNGTLGMNSMIVGPLTQTQSGVEGMLRFPADLVSLVKNEISNSVFAPLVDRFELRLSDLRIQNLNSVVTPLSLVLATNDGNVLENLINFVPTSDRSLELTVKLLIALDGDSSLSMLNEIDLSMSVDSLELFNDIYATMTSSSFLQLPVRHVLDFECWLAMIPETELSRDGEVDFETVRSFGLKTFLTRLINMSLGARCLECFSPGTTILPELMDVLENSGAAHTLGYRLESLVQSLLESDSIQSIMDRKLRDAHALCPISPKYNASAVRSNNSWSGFPTLSSNAVDTMLYAAVLAAEVGFVVFAENHRKQLTEPTSLLSDQDSLDVPEGIRLLDWMNLESSAGVSAERVIEEARIYLNSSDSDGGLRINDFLGDLIGKAGILDFNFDELSFEVDDFVVELKTARVKGLDSFSRFEVLEPVAPQTFQNFLQLDSLAIEVDLRVGFISASDAPREITLSFEVNDIEAEIGIFAALDLEKLGALELGSLLHMRNILPCILSTAYGFSVPQMNISVGSFLDPTVEGLMPDTEAAAATSIAAVVERFRLEIKEAIPLIFDRTVRQVANAVLDSYRSDSRCPGPELTTSTEFVDFRQMFLPRDSPDNGVQPFGDLPPLLKELLDSELLSTNRETGLSKINEVLVSSFTEDQSGEKGVLRMSANLFDVEVESLDAVGLDVIGFSVGEARVENLNTFKPPISLIDPNVTNGLLLDNRANLGGDPSPIRIGLTAALSFSGDPVLSSRNELDVLVELGNPDLFAVVLARMGVRKLMTFPLKSITNVHCWLSTFATPELDSEGNRFLGLEPGLALDALALAVSSIRFSASCASSGSCSSAGLEKLPEVLEKLDASGVTDVLEDRLLSFALDLLQNDYLQVYIDRLLVDSSHKCPEHPNFLKGASMATYPRPSFPTLSRDSLEAVAFAGALALEVAAVMVAETHATYFSEIVNPLSAQEGPLAMDEFRVLDFTSLGTTIGAWADTLVEEVKSYVGGQVDDSNGPDSRMDLGINNLARSFLLDDNRELTMGFDNVQIGGAGFEISLQEIRVSGLDSFTRFDILDAIGPQTLQNKFGLRRLRLELDLSIGLDSSASLRRSLAAEEMSISVSFEVTNIEGSLSLFLAVDQDALGDLELGQLLDTKRILPCLLSSAREVVLSELDVSLGKIESLIVEGFEGTDTAPAMELLTQLILEEYGDVLTSSVKPLFGVTIKAMLNNLLKSYLNQESNVSCQKNSFDSAGLRYVDFRDLLLSEPDSRTRGGTGNSPYGDLIRTLIEVVRKQFLAVDSTTGVSAVNSNLVGPLTEAQSTVPGSLFFGGDLFNQRARISVGGLDARINLRAYDAFANNVDTVGAPLSLFDTVYDAPNHLNNTASLGIGHPVQVGVRFVFGLKDDDNEELRNDLEITLNMETVTIMFTALLKVVEETFFGFPVRDIPNGQCWLAMMPAPPLDDRGVRLEGSEPSLSLVHLFASVSKLNMNITCISCSSPGMAELATLLSTPEATESATEAANDIFEYVTRLLGGEFLQVTFDRMLNDAQRSCPHSPSYTATPAAVTYESFESADTANQSIQFLIYLAIGTGCLIVFVSAVVIIVRLVVRRRHKKWLRSLSSERVFLLWQQQRADQQKEMKLNETTFSLFRSPQIPRWVRLIMPVVILGNIGFFLSGHLSLGATVNIEATLADQSFTVANFFEFSMAFSIVEIWNAGGKELAIMILLFSGVWPYTKQVITLTLWFLPPTRVSVSKRGSTFLWLDALAKWSMVDIFVLVITVAGFRVSVQSPDVGFLPDDFYSLDLLVVPMWGLYANMIAQIISQLSSHCIVYYHRLIVADATERYEESLNLKSTDTLIIDDEEEESTPFASTNLPLSIHAETKDKLASHAFARPHRGETDKLVARRGVDLMLIGVALVMSVLVILGCILPAFSQEILGIIGVMVESGQEFKQANKEHSLFSIIEMFFEQARFTGRPADFVGLGSLAALLFLSVLIVPVVQGSVLLYQWFRPMTRKTRGRIAVLVEILQAWQYAEVFLLAMIIASWQLGPVSEFMLNDYCGNLKGTFSQLVYYGILDELDAQCFRVESVLEIGSYILAAAAILLGLLNSFVMKAVLQYFRDLDAQDERQAGLDDDEPIEISKALEEIHPVSVLFTDTFRWFLFREDTMLSRQQSQVLDENCKLGITHGFPEGAVMISPENVNGGIDLPLDLLADTMADTGEDPMPLTSVEKEIAYPGVVMGLPLLMGASSDSSGAGSDSDNNDP